MAGLSGHPLHRYGHTGADTDGYTVSIGHTKLHSNIHGNLNPQGHQFPARDRHSDSKRDATTFTHANSVEHSNSHAFAEPQLFTHRDS